MHLPDSPPDPHDDIFHFGPDRLPRKFSAFRPAQWDAIKEINDAFRTYDVVFLEAPTGAGKTLIGETVRLLLKQRAYYTCTTKALQDQFANDFEYAAVLKGRSNYFTESGALDRFGNPHRHSWSNITCADCTGAGAEDDFDCQWCSTKDSCPFQAAKMHAVLSPLSVLNTAYLLSDPSIRSRGLVIADEADMLEPSLMSHIELEITPDRMKRIGLSPPARRTVEDTWPEWAELALQITREYYETLPKASHVPAQVKERNGTRQLIDKLKMLVVELAEGGWVYDGYSRSPDHVIFRPVKVAKYAPDYLWSLGDKWLLMSATILSPLLMADELGLDLAEMSWTSIKVPSSYPVENRPVYFSSVADMAFKNKETAWPKLAEGVEGVLLRHPGERVLVHTVSYELARYLHDYLGLSVRLRGRNLVTYGSSREKDAALDAYTVTPGSVLLAPSMDRGVDLPGDLCTVQVVAKVPYPNLKDKQINARMRMPHGQTWYIMRAIRNIVQSTGRGVRSSTDKATTYILDEQFRTNVWAKYDHLFPDWWKEALRWDLKPKQLTKEVS